MAKMILLLLLYILCNWKVTCLLVRPSSKSFRLNAWIRSASQTSNTETSSNLPLHRNALRGLNNCTSSTQARRILSQLKNTNNNALYNSILIPAGASSRGMSDADLAIQTRQINKKYSLLELIELSGNKDADRASLAVVCVTVASMLSAVVANQNLPRPEILRFLVVWILSFAPLALVGYGIVNVDDLQTLLVNIQQTIFPNYRQRMIQHEAGHFLMGHLLGWPVQGYSVNAVKNAVEFFPLADTDRASDYAQQLGFDQRRRRVVESDEPILPILEDRPFFSQVGRGSQWMEERSVFRTTNKTLAAIRQIDPRNDPTLAWPYRPLDDATLDQLTVISLAGVCAEILAFGTAEGGLADLNQLQQFFAAAELNEREGNNRIRFALGYTMSQLRRHLGALDALTQVMQRNGNIEECVYAIETCDNVSGQDGILGDYELRRREAFRSKGIGLLEGLLLGDDKNADTQRGTMNDERGKALRLTGDDPLYAALAVSIAFVAWASSGGLSLH